MFLKFIIIALIFYFVFKGLKNWLLGSAIPPNKQQNRPAEDNFQTRNQSKIEDADFEVLDDE